MENRDRWLLKGELLEVDRIGIFLGVADASFRRIVKEYSENEEKVCWFLRVISLYRSW